ncbi:caspase family protein [Hyphobacterium sp. CCMP332]|nr:caspase family protein [Hyphobacterium sp. CCMP332]
MLKNLVWLGLITLCSSVFAQEPALIKKVDPDKQSILAMASSPDGKWLVTGGDDNQVIFRDSENGSTLFKLTGHSDWVTAVEFSSFDDDMLKVFASGSRDGHVIIYDIEKRIIIYQNNSFEKTVNDIEIINSLNYLVAVSSDGQMSIVDLNSKQEVNKITVSSSPVLSVCAIPGTNNIATSDAEGKIRIWDALSGSMGQIIDAHDSYTRSIDFMNKTIISVGDDKSIKFWDAETGNSKSSIEKVHKKWIQLVESANDNQHYATGGHDGMVHFWELGKSEPIFSLKQNGTFVTGVSFSSDLNKIYTAGYGGDIQYYDISYLNLEPIKKYQASVAYSANKPSTANLSNESAKNEVVLVQPYIERGNTFYCLEEKIVIKGQLLSKSSIREFKIINKTTNEEDRLRVSDNQIFEHELPIRFKDNEISIRFTTIDGEVANKTIIVHRIFDQNNPDDLVKLTRNGRDYALIIATNSYNAMNDLVNPVFDATTIAAELENNYNFNVEKIINPPLDEIKLKIKEYSKKLYADEDQLFIFIAGHGEYDELFKEGYVVASNTKEGDEARSTYLPHSTLRTYINNIPCRHIFLTMDVCFGGTFDPFIAKRGNEPSKEEQVKKMLFIKRKMSYKTRIYLTSGGKEYVPDGRPGHHSPFARQFITALRTYGGSDGILTYQDLMSSVEMVEPQPRGGEFGDNEPGSNFLFIYK